MSRYQHTVIVPLTGSLSFVIDSDNPEPSASDLFEAAQTIDWRLKLAEDGDGRVDLGEEFSLHLELNRGNVCHAVCAEVELVETEDLGDSD
jgi:hypothetical protein